jgi:clan AA aspartic protease (TIGR02281 family)
MNNVYSLIFNLFFSLVFTAQTIIPITKINGVYEVPCNVNGKNVSFIFDSGAADVQLSKEFFEEGLSSGIFRNTDLFSDIVEFQVASGSIVKGRNVNIRHLKIGNLNLYNVVGSIIDSPNTPMLLGQSALERFGTYLVDYNKMNIVIKGNNVSNIEVDLIAKSKTIGMEGFVESQLKALAILPELEFEVVRIEKAGSDALKFDIDITNNSKLDYKPTLISFSVEVTTEDGKRYTSRDEFITQQLLSGQTGNSLTIFSIRDKKPIKLRIYSKLVGY